MKKFVLLSIFTILFITAYSSTTTLSLKVGQSQFVKLPEVPYGGYINEATWGCDNINVSLSEESFAGVIISVDKYFEGTARVTAWYNFVWYDNRNNPHVENSNAYYLVTCIGQKVTLDTSSITLLSGEGYQLKLSGASSIFVPQWSSNNLSVAQVNNSGYVTAVSPGSATIICDPIIGPEVMCSVTVKEVAPNKIEIQPTSVILTEGKNMYLTVVLKPNGAQVKDLTWSSDNPEIVKVNQNGLISAIKCGKATIKVQTNNDLSAVCSVSVVPIPTAVSLPENIELLQGYDIVLKPILTPTNSQTTYKWSSSNVNIVEVSSNGEIFGKGVGSADITVVTDNGKTAVCHVIVNKTPENMSKEYLNYKLRRISSLITKTRKEF